MRKMNRFYGMGILILVIATALMSGCCARLQSPIVFDSYCGGMSGCGYSSPCGGGYDPCCPPPCDTNYR